jgi:hypothetical protein
MGRTMIAALIFMPMLSGCGVGGAGEGSVASVDACQERMAEQQLAFKGVTVKGTFVYSASNGEDFHSLLPEDPAASGVIGTAVMGNGESARRTFLAEPAGDAPAILNIDPRSLVKIGFGPAKVEDVIAAGCGRIAKTIVLEHARLDRVEAEPSQDKST